MTTGGKCYETTSTQSIQSTSWNWQLEFRLLFLNIRRESDLVVVQQLRDVPGHEDPRVMTVEAEPVSLLLYPGMETSAVPPEAHAEQILVLGGVSQEETSLGLLVQ